MRVREIALVASMILAPYAVHAQEAKERRIQNERAGVDFTCHSRVDKESDHKFIFNHFIKNNSTTTPLSVKWKEAGIICVGASQLPPRNTDWGSSGRVTYQSPSLVDSDIYYGAKLDYKAPAEVYIDPQKASSNQKVIESTYARKDEQNDLVFSIQVISELKEDQSAQLTFRIYGGLSLLLAADAPREPITRPLIHGFAEPPAFGFADKSVDGAMRKWFESGNRTRFLVLENPTSGPVEVTTVFERGTFQGVLTLKEIHLVAFDPAKDGFVGLTARAYVPASLPVK